MNYNIPVFFLKQCWQPKRKSTIWGWFIPPTHGDFGDGLLLASIHYSHSIFGSQTNPVSFAQVRGSVLLPVICQLFNGRDQVQLRVVINVQRQRRVQRQVRKVQLLPQGLLSDERHHLSSAKAKVILLSTRIK